MRWEFVFAWRSSELVRINVHADTEGHRSLFIGSCDASCRTLARLREGRRKRQILHQKSIRGLGGPSFIRVVKMGFPVVGKNFLIWRHSNRRVVAHRWSTRGKNGSFRIAHRHDALQPCCCLFRPLCRRAKRSQLQIRFDGITRKKIVAWRRRSTFSGENAFGWRGEIGLCGTCECQFGKNEKVKVPGWVRFEESICPSDVLVHFAQLGGIL